MTDGEHATESGVAIDVGERAATDDRPGALVDVVLPGSGRLTVMSVAIAIIALPVGWGVLALVRAGSIAWPTLALGIVAAVVGVLLYVSVVMTAHQMRAERVLRECAGQGDGVLMGRLVQRGSPISVCEVLVKHERWGVTGRLARERNFTAIEPFCVPFEPQLVGEGEPPAGLREAAATADGASRGSGADDSAGPRSGRRGVLGRMKTAYRPVAVVLSWMPAALMLWVYWQTGSGWWLAIAIILVGVETFRLLGPGALGASRQCLAVPGGVVVRESGFLRQGWRVHVHDRRSSVLVAARKSDAVWFVQVADAAKKSSFLLKPGDVEFLLRAWLSPLRPPGVERLSDLR